MSRDWTPKEWDIVHMQDPGLKDHFNNISLVDKNGNTIPLTTQEQKEQFEQYSKLNLIGNAFLNLCDMEGIFSIKHGPDVIRMVENILLGVNYGSNLKEFEEKVQLWYDGQLEPGYYMDENDNALLEEVKYIIRNWDTVVGE